MRFHRMNTPGSTTSKRGPATVGVRSTKQRSAISALLDDIDGRVASSVLRAALFSAAK